MSEDPTSSVLMIVLYVAVGSLPVIFIIMVLKGLYRNYGETVVNASRSAKEAVISQSERARTALEVRKAEQELDRLLKLRDAGVISDQEFQQNTASIRKILRGGLVNK